VLGAIQQRVLWLATAIVDAAHAGDRKSMGVKVGGHQASSASMVSIMSALWFGELTAAAVLPGTTHVGVTRRPGEMLALITPFLDAR